MQIRVGIENNNDGRSIAWALEHPGCFAYGRDGDEARANMPQAVQQYADWVRQHGMSWMQASSLDVAVEQTFDAYMLPPGEALTYGYKQPYLVESFFHYDEQPLTGADVERALKLLTWTRQDLLDCIQGLSPDKLNQSYEGERWSINGILKHIGGSEWWYQERIGHPFPAHEQELSEDPMERLELVRAHFRALLPKLSDAHEMLKNEGEIWSPRKMLRRALWHERDHTEHIRKLI